MSHPKAETARKIKDLLIRVSPLIEEHTGKVCPACSHVCCMQKHGTFTAKDRSYLAALDVPVPKDDTARPPEAPCRFLGADGCANPRWLRAWKCTWFFCTPLLERMAVGPQKKPRALTALIEEIMRLRNKL